ncbi:unnamed protein product [Parascedosporium putredinis]|uniref:Bud22 domain-containing protein n=1 Tax=Parascedosporium putredinis TaxID=1442378 RepID=A0A9P1H5N1_9PEZI|nr:unnamed protein product [Parascedosporium putredinis]CAI7996541.1 unnamed protein product [Parascedosporium putredinis]
MPKRKRAEDSLDERLPQFKTDLFRALKRVKGFERQRLSRRLHEKGLPEEKKQKYDLEVAVLKSLDLHQTAFHYLYTSLLRIKSIASHPELPEEVRQEFPKPELDEKEKAALHHVTSCLFNRLEVRQVMDRIINQTCEALDIPPPEKKKPRKKGAKDRPEGEDEEGSKRPPSPSDGHDEDDSDDNVDGEADGNKARKPKSAKSSLGAEKDGKQEKKKKKGDQKKAQADKKRLLDDISISGGDEDAEDEVAEERSFSKYDRLLGGSSDSEAGSESDSDSDGGVVIPKGKTRSIRVRDMSISLSPESSEASDADDEPDEDVESESEFGGFSDSEAESLPPKPSKPVKPAKSEKPEKPSAPPKETKAKTAKSVIGRPTDSTFLPSLMGGYISGSESASDVDVAPRKTGLEPVRPQGKGKGKRDDGWDLRRGAVGEEDGGHRKPWKKGIDNPLAAMNREAGHQTQRPSPDGNP